ncbi:YdcF family protein [Sabulibacter ruber]|uniref:YdcF family protein n=1 Tax=Sabulibacter ruber TaxID=2811901 RepID=UPI001A965732|nr:YdcF family protein [Sabulibacter ruber]
MLLDAETISLSKLIWDYHQLHHRLKPADVILVLGSHDPRVAERGAELFLQGYAPWLLFSGGFGRLTEGTWTETEAEKFARIAEEMGVPATQILIENQSTNTGENIAFSYQLLKEKQIPLQRLILVQKPYMERRTYATFLKQWPGPEVEIMVTSPQLSFEEYAPDEVYRELVIHVMLGDLQRIKVYPEKGYQAHQEIPAEVWDAFEQLKQKGFTSHLLSTT